MRTDSSINTILLVEDNEVVREGLARVLRGEGHAVAVAANGREALAALRGGLRPALVLLDMLLPGLDGWRFLEQWRADRALPPAPFVVVTGLAVASPEWAASLGARGLVRKPVEAEDLLREVNRCLPLGG
jgi:CheY-like chemotaxis protein